MRFLILIGTMTGNAEIVAEKLSEPLPRRGIRPRALIWRRPPPPGLPSKPRPGAGGRIVLICTSTYGDGDVPDNALDFYESLARDRPDLSGLRYGVVALGDQVYETYANGGQRFDERLRELGASRIGEVCRHDASSGSMPEEEALAWLPTWLERAEAEVGVGQEGEKIVAA